MMPPECSPSESQRCQWASLEGPDEMRPRTEKMLPSLPEFAQSRIN